MPFINRNGGNKAALIIGINYLNSDLELNGCINDAKNVENFLRNTCNYRKDSIFVLTDNTSIKPTKKNIISYFKIFVDYIKKNNVTEAWFSYSGHGHYQYSSTEKDFKNEVLVPINHNKDGFVTDDNIYDFLIKNIPKTCTLFSIIDACHSGTPFDLPYLYSLDKGITQQKNDENLANIIKIGGCKDDQYSIDALINGTFQGVLTTCFLKSIKDMEFNFTCKQLIKQINGYVKGGNFKQIPTLTFSHENLLNAVVMGQENSLFSDSNVEISMTGDKWCNSETTWNIYDIKNKKNIFSNDIKFYIRDEKVTMDLNLDDGNYKLIITDSYGDGGVNSGFIKNLKNGNKLSTFEFKNGKNKTIHFSINNKEKNNEPVKEHEIKIIVLGDRWSKYETKWNILDSNSKSILKYDKNFLKNKYYFIRIKLKEGLYKIKCMDSWGDGGMTGRIEQDDKVIKEFNFTTSKLKFYEFEIKS